MELLWIAGFGALLWWVVRAHRAARTAPAEPVSRAHAVAGALAIAVLGVAAAHAWSVATAQGGMTRILAAGDDPAAGAPARARLFLRNAQLLLTPAPSDETDGDPAVAPAHVATIGFSPDAALRLPRGYGLAESKRGWDLLAAEARGPQGLTLSALPARERTDTRLVIAARRRGDAPPGPDEMAREARAITGRGDARCTTGEQPSAALDGPGAIYVILCSERIPRAALVFERDLNAQTATDAQTPLRVTPMIWRGASFHPHHVEIASGSLVQIGAMADALPGVTLWEVPAPAGRAELFFPPSNILASCEEWLDTQQRGDRGFVSAPIDEAAFAPPNPRAGDHPVCVLPFTPPFGLEVRRLLPDVPSIAARALWAVGVLITPALALLLAFCTRPRSQMTRRRFATAMSLGWLSTFIAAVACWRLLWAHRIDMLRDYESVGVRVVGNQLIIVLAGAALAAMAVALGGRARARRSTILALAVLAHLAWLLIGGYALGADLAVLSNRGRIAGQLILSLAIGTAPLWLPLLGRRARPRLDARPWHAAMAGLAALTVTALIAEALFPRAVIGKLAFVWALILIFYGGLRACISPAGMDIRRVFAVFTGGAVAAMATATFDPGVTVAIAGPGMVVALLFAGHDARFDTDSVRRIAGFERHHAPLVLAQAALAGLLGLAIIIWALPGLAVDAAPAVTAELAPPQQALMQAVAGDVPGQPVETADLSRQLTFGAIHLLLFTAALLLSAAALAFWRKGAWAAAPWAVAAMLVVGVWSARGPILGETLESSSQAANRIAIVVDPGYALLRSETKFLAGITAWRETIPPGGTPDVSGGQGYFGAQLIDPGVLLSVENDYFPVLLLREAGVRGLVATALLLFLLLVGAWLVATSRFRHGSAPQRLRGLAAIVLGLLCVYQPLASLGVLPLTGIAWPGFGLDSPTDFWLLLALAAWMLVWPPAIDRTADPGEAELDAYDAELRRSRAFRRARLAAAAGAGAIAVAAILLIARAGVFAMHRPNPVDAAGRTAEPFDSLERAVDYAYQLQCPWEDRTGTGAELVPDDLLADPIDDGVRRFHNQLRRAWTAGTADARAVLGAFLGGQGEACPAAGRRVGAWWFERTDDPAECRASFKFGWPEIQLSARRAPEGQHRMRCRADVRTDVLRQLRLPVKQPYRDARVRLVNRPMGVAARDRGELVSGHVVVRLRPGAGAIDVADGEPGMYFGDSVRIADELTIRVSGESAALETHAGRSGEPQTWLFVRDPPRARFQVLEAEDDSWRLLPPDAAEIPLDRTALIVLGGPHTRSLWLYRPPSTWSGETEETVGTLLADDIGTVRGEHRRFYLYGGLLPELGWVNPYQRRMSLGLDGWVRVAMAEYETSARAPRTRWIDGTVERSYCGTLAPAGPAPLERVCAQSPLDGVLECRVSLQPELEIRLRHLTELIAASPARFAGEDPARTRLRTPARASFALVRGDTGEILAQGEHVPGRASTAYAPATPELEQHLIRLREDRDPDTGERLSALRRGEASAEKIDWSRPIAVGSTMKPMLGRAFELADPALAGSLTLTGSRMAGARCRGGTHAIFGHCPPTDSLWNHEGTYDMASFLAESVNWFQAAIGILGTAVPRGTWGAGETELTAVDLLGKNVGDYPTRTPLWTRHRGKTVIDERRMVDLAALRETTMWQRFEGLLGRPLCTRGNKPLCRRASARRDLCPARALPIEAPTSDLRHLVAAGPASFDFYPRLADPSRTVRRVHSREYLQFLRGSGLHPLGSLLQITDAFNRVVYDEPDAEGQFDLAASWFPVAPAGQAPASCARATGVRRGLCEVVRTGTASGALAALIDDPRLEIYGAKTGTIDSLADIAERPEACARFNQGHTVPGLPADAASQPYWLDCRKRAAGSVNDSLLLISFGVRDADGRTVPLTLGLRFQRSGPGLAARVARHYLDAITAYVAPQPAQPGQPRSPTGPALPR